MHKAPLFLLLALAGCTLPPPSAQVATSGDSGAMLDLGRTPAGDACRLAPSGNGGDVFCGDWTAPSARIRSVAAPDAMAGATNLSAALASQLDCAAPRATRVLGGQPAALAAAVAQTRPSAPNVTSSFARDRAEAEDLAPPNIRGGDF